eukprot:Selendium_serpulae@DN6138_c0_g2_i6.p1
MTEGNFIDPTTANYTQLCRCFADALSSRNQSDLALRYGTNLLSRYSHKLGSQLWIVLEQVFMVAIEFRQQEWVTYCLRQFTKQFPGSNTVSRFEGMAKEARGDYDGALDDYGRILAKNPGDLATRRR